ncbi:MAG: dynamin family protein, partial [Selenomonadaceae bacterium]|nr:dynamin family protein [Selenomonadaceae bacterium]
MNKEELINKLQTTEEVLKKILAEDKNAIVISFEDQDRLQSLQNRNENILRKLKTDEFSVAIVGLEKAGKSTVGNALIKMAILPEYTERCTYTTTEIRAGDRDEAIISFYKHEQFNKNFQDM